MPVLVLLVSSDLYLKLKMYLRRAEFTASGDFNKVQTIISHPLILSAVIRLSPGTPEAFDAIKGYLQFHRKISTRKLSKELDISLSICPYVSFDYLLFIHQSRDDHLFYLGNSRCTVTIHRTVPVTPQLNLATEEDPVLV